MSTAKTLDALLENKKTLETAVENVPTRQRMPASTHDFAAHEEEALTLLSYQNQVVPGLLPTKEYAGAVC